MKRGALALAILILLATGSAAVAAPGDLIAHGCISDGGAGGCPTLGLAAADSLDAPGGTAMSLDGRDLYVGANFGITQLRRASDGTLTFADRTTSSNFNFNGILVEVAPSGNFVYAISLADSLVWFSRNETTGELTQLGCIDASTDADCGTAPDIAGGNFPSGSIDFAQELAVTPDGETLYIADQDGSLLRAQIDPTTGEPTPAGCYRASDAPIAGCAALPIPANPTSVTVSPDSAAVYLNAISGALFHFSRNTSSGATSLQGCADGSIAAPCTLPIPSDVTASLGRLQVSPIGGTLYAQTSPHPTDATLSRLSLNASGTPAFVNCVSTRSPLPASCGALPSGTLGPSGQLAISADGQSVYTAIGNGAPHAISRFRDDLSLASCVSDGTVAGCSNIVVAPRTLSGAKAIVLSPDGRDLYSPGTTGGAVGDPALMNIFAVEGTSSGVGAGTPAPIATPSPLAVAPRPRIGRIRRDRKGRYKVTVTVDRPTTIAADLTGKLSRRARTRAIGRRVSRTVVKAGRLTITLRPSRTARRRKVRAKLTVTSSPPGMIAARATKTVRLR